MSGIADLADALHARTSVWKAMAMLKIWGNGYFDETGTHDESRITAIGGYVGKKDSWAALEPQWLEILEAYRERGVRFFHMSEALAQRDQFSRIDKPNMNYIITQLSQLLGNAYPALEPFFAAVVNEDWEAVVRDEDFLRRYPKPLDLCFDNLIQNLWRWAKTHTDGELVVPIFAYSAEYSARMAEIGRLYGAHEWYRKVLGPIAFDYPERVVPLQAADLIAHQMNWDVEKRAFGPHELWNGGTNCLRWATGGRFTHGNWFDAQGLKVTIERFKRIGQI
jgi:uncharacterized protein DUF3800